VDRLAPVIGLVAFAVVGFVIYRLLAGERERKARRGREAALQGFRPVTPPDPAVVERIIALHRRPGRTALEVRDLYRREDGDRTLYLFDLADTSSESTDLVCDRAVLIVSPALGLPRFSLVPQLEQHGTLGRLANWVIRQVPGGGGDKVEFPASPAFQQRYALMTTDEPAVRRCFTAERLARLAETRYWIVEAEGDGLTLDRLGIDVTGRRPGTIQLADRLSDAKRGWEIFGAG
jgi:hypothetical protein